MTLGVDYGQGFAIGRPAPLTELLEELPSSAVRIVRPPTPRRWPAMPGVGDPRLAPACAPGRRSAGPARPIARAGAGLYHRTVPVHSSRSRLPMTVRSRTMLALLGGIVLGVAVSMAGRCWPIASRRRATRSCGAAPRSPRPPRASPRVDGMPWEDARLLAEILERVKPEYVDEVDDHELMENAVRGLVSGLDPYSAYLDRDEYDEIRLSTAGSYPGIGVEVAAEQDGIKVLRPIADSPADRAGLRTGDVIVRIDDAPVQADVDAAIDQMRGPAGTPGQAQRAARGRAAASSTSRSSARRSRSTASSPQRLDAGFGYLRIVSFSDTTAQDVTRAAAQPARAAARRAAARAS